MKKFLVSVLAIAGLVACHNEEAVRLPEHNQAIAFADAFVENATRVAEDPSTKTETIAAFDVWAWMDEKAGIVLGGLDQNDRNGGENVEKKNGVWVYDNVQYWTPDHDFHFVAVAPMDSANWTYNYTEDNIAFTNVDGTEDLLFVFKHENTDGKNINSTYDAVELQFAHLLSKTKFTFTNGFDTNNMFVEVSDIKMTAPESATFDFNFNTDNREYTEGWGAVSGTKELAYGAVAKTESGKKNESTFERFTIPASAAQEYVVTYTITIYRGTVVDYTADKTSVITGVEFEKGKSYNFVAEINPEILNMQEIKFNVVVDEWVPETPEEVELPYMYDEDTNVYVVDNAEGLAQVFEDVAAEDKTDVNVVLGGDIDLSAISLFSTEKRSNWIPVGSSEKPFTGTFDGKGYTIKNLTLVEDEAKEGKAYIGFFGYAKNATIKNVTFENVYINIPCLDIDHSQGHIGAVAGSLEGTSTIENVTVKGDIQVYATQTANGASRVAVVAGGNSYGDVTMKNVHVVANDGSSLIANNNTGALAGQLQGKMVFENCSSNIDVTVNKFFAGGLIGIAAGDSYFKNCHTTGDVAVVAGREGRHNDEYRVGGIAGGWADGKTKVCTLENCSYTGNVSGKNADGTVAEPLDYMGYVGRGYTLANCAGSKVIIDGTEFIQKYDDVYGVYTINTPVSTADELVAALAAGKGVYLLNDITIAATKGGYNKAGILQNKAQTIDGCGHTLTVTGAGATWDCAIYTNGGVIRNLTVAGAMRGIFTAGQSADLHIENVEFKKVIYTFNSDGKMPADPFGVYVSNSKVNGWTSHSNMHTEVVYTNCSFGEGSGYKYCRPYGKTEFVNCTFCAGYTVDQSKTTDITFTNCKFE